MTYKTVLHTGIAYYEEKKSKFIASVKPVETEEEAILFIQELKTKYWNARHNVYAYSIGVQGNIQRYSDDGEPSGTAGLPTLEVLKKLEVRNLVIVITRYFGGILLGAAGLVRAYGKSASLGVEAAGLVKRVMCQEVSITMEYHQLGKVQNLVLSQQFITKDIHYGQDVEMRLLVPPQEMDRLKKLIDDATSAGAFIEVGEVEYITVDEEGKYIH